MINFCIESSFYTRWRFYVLTIHGGLGNFLLMGATHQPPTGFGAVLVPPAVPAADSRPHGRAAAAAAAGK